MLSITIGFKEVNVLFTSDRQIEIKEMLKYFDKVWDISYENAKSIYWNAESKLATDNELEYLRNLEFYFAKESMYDLRSSYIYDDENLYVVTLDYSSYVCMYRKEKKTILYRTTNNDVIETIKLSQIIKDPILSYLKLHGYVVLHCSACFYRGMGIVFPANKKGGKTTLLTHFMDLGASYTGNDSALCKLEQDKVVIKSYPHMSRIGLETANANERLNQFLYAEGNIENKAHDYFLYGTGAVANGKIQLMTYGLAELFNISVKKTFAIDIIIFPSFDVNAKSCSFEYIGIAETHKLLYESTFSRDQNVQWLPYYPREMINQQERHNFNSLLQHITGSYIFTFGRPEITNPLKVIEEFFDSIKKEKGSHDKYERIC